MACQQQHEHMSGPVDGSSSGSDSSGSSVCNSGSSHSNDGSIAQQQRHIAPHSEVSTRRECCDDELRHNASPKSKRRYQKVGGVTKK